MSDGASSRSPSNVPAANAGAQNAAERVTQASELAERLGWLVRLRWGAAGALVLGSIVGPAVGLSWLWPSFLLLAATVASYNALVCVCMNRLAGAAAAPQQLPRVAVAQIALDLLALLIAVHFTGGLFSPLLAFFGFHMAIGTIIVSTGTMYPVAALTSLGAIGLQLLHASGWLPRHDLADAPASAATASSVAMLALVAFLLGIVYLTGTVTDRLKERNHDLRRTSEALRLRSAELQRLLAEVAELERRKSHYMRISAHQLRSPLATVRTSLDVLAGGYVELGSARAQHLVRGAAERVNGLLRTVNGLLDLAKVREGQERAPRATHVSLNQLVTDVVDALSPFAQERGVTLRSALRGIAVLDSGIPPDLVHAIENLIHNAIKYSHAGGEVLIHLDVDRARAVLRVKDQGIGVPSEFRHHLFLEFVRAPNARAHAPEGTGLGLALVREVATAHGGDVVLEENDAPGASFRLELPLHRPPREPAPPLHAGNGASYHNQTRPAAFPGGSAGQDRTPF